MTAFRKVYKQTTPTTSQMQKLFLMKSKLRREWEGKHCACWQNSYCNLLAENSVKWMMLPSETTGSLVSLGFSLYATSSMFNPIVIPHALSIGRSLLCSRRSSHCRKKPGFFHRKEEDIVRRGRKSFSAASMVWKDPVVFTLTLPTF